MQLTAKSVLFSSAHNLRLCQIWEGMWARPVCVFLWIFTIPSHMTELWRKQTLHIICSACRRRLLIAYWHARELAFFFFFLVPAQLEFWFRRLDVLQQGCGWRGCIVTTFTKKGKQLIVWTGCCRPSSLSGSSTPRLPGASFPSADRVAALLLLASEAWVGVSRRLRTPPSTVLDGGLRATRPKIKKSPKNRRRTQRAKKRGISEIGEESITKGVGVD